MPISGGGWTIWFDPSSLVISLQQTPVEPCSKEQSLVLASSGEICEAHWTKGLHTSSLGQVFCTALAAAPAAAGGSAGVAWFVGSVKISPYFYIFSKFNANLVVVSYSSKKLSSVTFIMKFPKM